MRTLRITPPYLLAFALFLLTSNVVRADVGVIVYESKGVDARRTSTGHMSLVATSLCADGIDKVRTCGSGEEPGVAITRYPNVAYGYGQTIFIVPLRDHFMATDEARLIPVLSSGGTLDAMQIEYWRAHLRPYLPPLSQERYRELKSELERFNMGRTFRKLISMELLVGALAPRKNKGPTDPIALIDPLTKELIPSGRWREAIGAAHQRTSIMVTIPTSAEQEEQLIPFIEAVNAEPFNALSDNCSDFVERSLLKVFAESGLRFRPRISNVANAWITSPINVVSEFLNYARRDAVPITVTVVPMLAGTRRPSVKITSIAYGALVPNPAQGKLAFGMKIYFNTLNPLLGLTSYSVDKLSRFANLQRLVHERGGGELSRLASDIDSAIAPRDEDLRTWRREQVRVFGTTSCWKAKQEQFTVLVKQAEELGLLTAAEQRLVLHTGRPFLLPRLYERAAAVQKREGVLLAGMSNQALAPRGMLMSFLPPDNRKEAEPDTVAGALVPGRAEIQDMAQSGQPTEQVLTFKLMTSLINYDLSSEAVHRRTSEAFDKDWRLLLEVAEDNGLRLPTEGPLREPLEACSCREFEEGKASRDAFGDALNYWHQFTRGSRAAAFGANR